MNARIEVEKVPYEIRRKTSGWIAINSQLKTFGYSKVSEEEAVKDFRRALKIFIEVHEEIGTLQKALDHFGWNK